MTRWITLLAMAVLAMLVMAVPAQAWPKSPSTAVGCYNREVPNLCLVHYWADRVHRDEKARGLPRRRYYYTPERHPERAPWLTNRLFWRSLAWKLEATPVYHAPSGGMAGLIVSIWAPAVGSGEATQAVTVATCESGLRPDAYNPSGATGLFQILGGPTDPVANTRMALSMYESRSWEPWTASQSCWG